MVCLQGLHQKSRLKALRCAENANTNGAIQALSAEAPADSVRLGCASSTSSSAEGARSIGDMAVELRDVG